MAMQVIDHDASTLSALDGTALEAVLGKELRHPNIVQTLKYVHRRMHRTACGTMSIAMGANSSGSNAVSSSVGVGGFSKPRPSPLGGDQLIYMTSASTPACTNQGKDPALLPAVGTGRPVADGKTRSRKASMEKPAIKEVDGEVDGEGAAAAALWPVIHLDEDPDLSSQSMDWPMVGKSEEVVAASASAAQNNKVRVRLCVGGGGVGVGEGRSEAEQQRRIRNRAASRSKQ